MNALFTLMGSVILECIDTGGKLRIRFKEYIDANGKKYGNAYDNSYNCQFPKKDGIRKEGRCYQIPENDISLVKSENRRPFYSIKKGNIKILGDSNEEKFNPEVDTIFDAGICVICLDQESTKIFTPCGHKCTCDDCTSTVYQYKKQCPLCRRDIIHIM